MNNVSRKAVLCALNSKYVHTSLSVRYIKAYADKHCKNVKCSIVEETINQDINETAKKILAEKPDIAAFSCYIWNIEQVLEICEVVKKENSETVIVLGGPEVSFNPKDYLKNSDIDYVQCGDGEKPITVLFDCIATGENIPEGFGICYKYGEEFVISSPYCEKDLDSIESPYTEEYLSAVNGRIAYMESSRGCPFSCAFCLSGADRGVRYFSGEYTEKAILKLWKSGAKTIKFIDRTFNAKASHADGIISFILENRQNMPDNVCFHFEISADILRDSTINLLKTAPSGLFQIEAGLQSFNHHTLEEVSRKTDTDKICENVKRIISFGNIHTHIDLIAGLPYEDFESFRDSFNKAYSVGASMLQLGFLKLLHGSRMRNQTEEYGYEYSDKAPYEIISTKWVSSEEMKLLKEVEDANEKIANSGRFERALEYVLSACGKTPFDLFLDFGRKKPMPLDDYTALVFEYFSCLEGVDRAKLRDLMCCDRLSTNTSGKLPECLKIQDKLLAKITYQLEINPETAPKAGEKRAVCILYTEDKAVYADYNKNTPKGGKIKLNFVDLL